METKKKYDQNKYNLNFINKNKDKINESIICDVCYGKYKYFTKAIHIKSKRHIIMLDKVNKQNNQ